MAARGRSSRASRAPTTRRDRADDRDDRVRHGTDGARSASSCASSSSRWRSGSRSASPAGCLLLPLLRRVRAARAVALPAPRPRAAPGVVYGVAAVAHGSGFLAVFVAGILIGDARVRARARSSVSPPRSRALPRSRCSSRSGSRSTSACSSRRRLAGRASSSRVAARARRPAAGRPARFSLPRAAEPGERLFIIWGGLKGAVPILLAALAVSRHVDQAPEIYGIVFVVVLFSVACREPSCPPWQRGSGAHVRGRSPPRGRAEYPGSSAVTGRALARDGRGTGRRGFRSREAGLGRGERILSVAAGRVHVTRERSSLAPARTGSTSAARPTRRAALYEARSRGRRPAGCESLHVETAAARSAARPTRGWRQAPVIRGTGACGPLIDPGVAAR